MKRLIAVTALVALMTPGCAEARTRLSGAGASFPSKIYQRWFADFAKEGGHRVNYQAVGSGSGRKAFLDETVDFGASDDPMKQGDIAKAKRGMVQIPMTGGTIAFGYNNPGCDLKLTQEQAVQVAIGEINNWNQVGCEDQAMTWVYRSDGSGTTAAFTNSMKAFSKKWKLGTGKSVAWPVGIGNKGNAGVAGNIRTTPGSIGYVNQSMLKVKSELLNCRIRMVTLLHQQLSRVLWHSMVLHSMRTSQGQTLTLQQKVLTPLLRLHGYLLMKLVMVTRLKP